MTPRRRAASSASASAAGRRRTRPRSATSSTCSSKHESGAAIFAEINAHLPRSIQISGGSTRRFDQERRGQRDPKMHQVVNGKQRHFGVDGRTILIHSVVVPAANAADWMVMSQVLHGGETRVWGDKAYDGQSAAIAAAAPAAQAQGHTHDEDHRHRPLANHYKSTIRAKIERPIGTIKRVFGLTKVRYRGLARTSTDYTSRPRWRTCSWSASDYRRRSVSDVRPRSLAMPSTVHGERATGWVNGQINHQSDGPLLHRPRLTALQT